MIHTGWNKLTVCWEQSHCHFYQSEATFGDFEKIFGNLLKLELLVLELRCSLKTIYQGMVLMPSEHWAYYEVR